MAGTYILVLFFTIIICFVASFDKRIRFDRHFLDFLKGVTVVAIPFIAWDVWFTARGVWWFNLDYTLGLTVFGLPIEEWLFFFCIPFSCVFTYYCIDKFFNLESLSGFNTIVAFVGIIVVAVVGLQFTDRIYTLVTALVTIGTLIYLHFVARVSWLTQATLTYGILMLGFFPVNGVLTGFGLESPIVNYNPEEFMEVRMLTIPVEDAVYGYAQFVLTIHFFKYFKAKSDSAYGRENVQ